MQKIIKSYAGDQNTAVNTFYNIENMLRIAWGSTRSVPHLLILYRLKL